MSKFNALFSARIEPKWYSKYSTNHFYNRSKIEIYHKQNNYTTLTNYKKIIQK